MPCVAMTPAMPMPRDTRCGAHSASPAPASASVRPLPTSVASSPKTLPSSSFYARLWKFLLHNWSAAQQPENKKIPIEGEGSQRRRRRFSAARLSASTEMRRRVGMLHELETHHLSDGEDSVSRCDSFGQRGPRAMQATCSNCRQRFFREMGAASDSSTSEYCSLDCRSSAQYRATVQKSIDSQSAFDTISPSVSSRL